MITSHPTRIDGFLNNIETAPRPCMITSHPTRIDGFLNNIVTAPRPCVIKSHPTRTDGFLLSKARRAGFNAMKWQYVNNPRQQQPGV
jgi:hypothetical protein